jgi:hypothetical protein
MVCPCDLERFRDRFPRTASGFREDHGTPNSRPHEPREQDANPPLARLRLYSLYKEDRACCLSRALHYRNLGFNLPEGTQHGHQHMSRTGRLFGGVASHRLANSPSPWGAAR